MSEPYIGQINLFAFGVVPRYYAQCNGQLLPISQNTALFSLLGTYYGGDGRQTFALPNLQSSVAIGTNDASPGIISGSETVALIQSQLPTHTHGLMADATTDATANTYAAAATTALGQTNAVPNGVLVPVSMMLYTTQAPNTPLSYASIGQSGNSTPHSNIMPYLGLNYCIALSGIFPSRN
jgi:microcystin-dependent protein